eukprot:scaffold10442_cov106-Isochrysis_galbana.AAC.2
MANGHAAITHVCGYAMWPWPMGYGYGPMANGNDQISSRLCVVGAGGTRNGGSCAERQRVAATRVRVSQLTPPSLGMFPARELELCRGLEDR